MIDTDNIMHPQHFGTDRTDISIRINPKIKMQIPDHLRLKFWCRRKFALSECLFDTVVGVRKFIQPVNELLQPSEGFPGDVLRQAHRFPASLGKPEEWPMK